MIRTLRSVTLALALASAVVAACADDEGTKAAPSAASSVPLEEIAPSLPAPGTAASAATPSSHAVRMVRSCPEDMVRVRDAFCIDRYESSLVDDATSTALSPYYPPERGKALYLEKLWREKAGTGTAVERATRLPELPAVQRQRAGAPRAVSRRDAIPQAYASMRDADTACRNAKKRLCTADEWKTACRGEEDRDFPYGDTYQQGTCNIFRDAHPGILLWDDPTINHTDPRFNLMRSKSGPLLRKTGATPGCASKWGSDAVFDMVGNVDEWIDDPEGTFLGGFYARSKKDGCQSSVGSHVPTYADYSTGVRCCADLPAPVPEVP